ncbi:phospho-sugar mutase [Mycoplasmopsis gallinarum]|uniref:phospho-sugar mutase n=1 Tax=Mycoplasmopsis gallinarum TaxID=29557 RepID=UPI00047F914C|nr:phospho-sugar mutase [Mycoplasmopsis gallinarum]
MQKLDFGTAGIRGILGKEPYQLNYFHVARVIDAYAQYLRAQYGKKASVVIGRDNRKMSCSFSKLAAYILDSYQIKVWYVKDIAATPFISYLTKIKKASGAINFTASHNPKNYNGIKLYNHFGAQCLPEEIDAIKKYFKDYEWYQTNFKLPQNINLAHLKNLNWTSKRDLDNYVTEVANLGINIIPNVKIAYSPLHGTGSKIMPLLLTKLGFTKVNNQFVNAFLSPEQMKIDRHFKTIDYPNPEYAEAYNYVKKLGLKHQADLLLLSDPDSDRVGLSVWNGKEYVNLNGNETALLIFYFLNQTNFYKNKNDLFLVYSFVSSNLPSLIATKHNIKSIEVPTGFKWIAKIINENKQDNFAFGFEESYGSLINSNIANDKDAFQSIALIIKMASYYKNQNLNLLDVLNSIYEEFGYVSSETLNFDIDDNFDLNQTIDKFINLNLKEEFNIEDYRNRNDFMKSQMIKLKFNDNSWIAMRPSGTEPKIKFYIFAFGKDENEANKKFNNFKIQISQLMNK